MGPSWWAAVRRNSRVRWRLSKLECGGRRKYRLHCENPESRFRSRFVERQCEGPVSICGLRRINKHDTTVAPGAGITSDLDFEQSQRLISVLGGRHESCSRKRAYDLSNTF